MESRENRLLSLISDQRINNSEFELPFFIGADRKGEYIFDDLASLPHTIICGITGTGKTTLLQTSLALMAIKKGPDTVRFIICNSKAADYKMFEKLPHLYLPLICDLRDTVCAVQWALFECNRRFKIFSENGVRDIVSFNLYNNDGLPRIVLVIDDLYDLLQSASADDDYVSDLQSILIKGRQAGVHCVFVTSTPSDKLLKKKLLPHIPGRECFTVASAADSKSIIDVSNASKLDFPGKTIYKGRNLFCVSDVPFVSDEELQEAIGEIIKDKEDSCATDPNLKYFFRWDCSSLKNNKINTQQDNNLPWGELDEMLPAAVDAVLEAKSCSVSMLQRRVKLGYSRSARIVDQLESIGVVGPYEGAKPRSVLIDREGWETLAKQLGFDVD